MVNVGRHVSLSLWTTGDLDTEVSVWPLGDGARGYPELANRITVALYTGSCNVTLRPTAGEARDLIAALQWALETAEVPAEVPA